MTRRVEQLEKFREDNNLIGRDKREQVKELGIAGVLKAKAQAQEVKDNVQQSDLVTGTMDKVRSAKDSSSISNIVDQVSDARSRRENNDQSWKDVASSVGSSGMGGVHDAVDKLASKIPGGWTDSLTGSVASLTSKDSMAKTDEGS